MLGSVELAVLAAVLLCAAAEWPHGPYAQAPIMVGVDRPGLDFPNMPFALESAEPELCQNICINTTGCLAWAYGVPNCGGSNGTALCWLKSGLPGTTTNECRVSNYINIGCRQISQWGADLDVNNVLPEYPRPQMVRPNWQNLNGFWEFQPGYEGEAPPFGVTLNGTILVPFPVESCLSGIGLNYQYLWYRQVFQQPFFASGNTLLHFGAVDWQTAVWVNGQLAGNHTGGYDSFFFDITSLLTAGNNEIIVGVFDPSDSGVQPFGKQSIFRIYSPGGDTYTPSSGIWQTVWVENVQSEYVTYFRVWTSLDELYVMVNSTTPGTFVNVVVYDENGNVYVNDTGVSGQVMTLPLDSPILWSPSNPYLYNYTVWLGDSDSFDSYFGVRTFTLGQDQNNVTRPLLNGEFLFLSGWLDQGFWPDGIYTAPSDAALASDLQAILMFGMNMVRKHQKVEPARWYYWADKLGIIVFQDMIQHYGCNSVNCPPSQEYYLSDLTAMINGKFNHPSIVQWEAFNEDDMVSFFNPAEIIAYIAELDPTRLIDTDSGGPANSLYIGDVNDIHDYPYPQDPLPSATQYAMIGEFGGIGAYVLNKEWVPNQCGTYLNEPTPAAEAAVYISMLSTVAGYSNDISVCVYTQITDVELECDGFLNYDRSNKFSNATTQAIYEANQNLINSVLVRKPKRSQ